MGQEIAGLCSLGEQMTWQNPTVPLTLFIVSNLGFLKNGFSNPPGRSWNLPAGLLDLHKGTVLCE